MNMKQAGLILLLTAFLIACFVTLIRSHDNSGSIPHTRPHAHNDNDDKHEQAPPVAITGSTHGGSVHLKTSPSLTTQKSAVSMGEQPPASHLHGEGEGVLSAEEEASWRASLPRRDVARREVNDDSHSAPSALVQLAPLFATLMKNARESVDQARNAFAKFAICAKDTEGVYPSSLKVSCFVNAKALAADYPSELAGAFSELSGSLNDSTKKLVEAYDSF